MVVRDIIASKYEVIQIIKKSDFSQVGICINKYLNNEWLIKFIPKMTSGNSMQLNELNHLIELNHCHIPKIIDVYYQEDGVYYIMEHIHGMSLREYVLTQTISIRKILLWMKSLSQVLEHVHSREIVHGDIKPENILVLEDDSLALVDFGSSFKTTDTHSFTLDYVAPERLLDTFKVDERSDLYSVGVLFKTLIKKQNIFSLKKYKLNKIINKCKRINPNRRLGYAVELFELLDKI